MKHLKNFMKPLTGLVILAAFAGLVACEQQEQATAPVAQEPGKGNHCLEARPDLGDGFSDFR